VDIPPPDIPIVCDLTGATDTGPERLAEYHRLFAAALLGRERTRDGVRFRFRADPGIEPWVRDLAAREKACCAFFAFAVTPIEGEVVWDATVSDNEAAREILEEFYALPDSDVRDIDALQDRLADRGLRFSSDPTGTIRRLRPAESA
jgi:hypothetical protein